MTQVAIKSTGCGEDTLARGTVALLGAQFAYFVGGCLLHLCLGRTLGPADYGVFGVVMAFLVWVEVSLTGGFPYAIRKFGAENRELMPAVARAAMRGQALYAAMLFVLAFAAAPWVARLLRDPGLAGFIRLSSVDIPIFAYYYCFTAVLNGRRHYFRHAAAIAAYTGAKVSGILILVALGFGVRGAIVGNVAASVVGLAAAWCLAGRLPESGRCPVHKLTKFAGSTAALSILFTLLIHVDIFVVKAVSDAPASVGYYTAASTLARAPFYVFIGIVMAALPAVSRAATQADDLLLRQYVAQALRLYIVLFAPVAAIVAGAAAGTVDLLYSARYALAAPALAILIGAFMLFGLVHVLQNLLVAVGDTQTPLVGTAALTAIDIALSVWLVPPLGIVGAAIAALVASAVGLAATGIVCARRFGVLMPAASTVRAASAALVVYGLARLLPVEGLLLVGLYPVLCAAYVAALVGLGEITRKDFSKLTAAAGLSTRFRKFGYVCHSERSEESG